jgi:hypothetical protein
MSNGCIVYHHGFASRVLEHGPIIDEQITVSFQEEPDVARYERAGIYIGACWSEFRSGDARAFVTRMYSVAVTPIPNGFR